MVKTRSGAGVDVNPNKGKDIFSLTHTPRYEITQVPLGDPPQNLPVCLQVLLDNQQPVPQSSISVSQLGQQPLSQLGPSPNLVYSSHQFQRHNQSRSQISSLSHNLTRNLPRFQHQNLNRSLIYSPIRS